MNRDAFAALLAEARAFVDERLAVWLRPKTAAAAALSAEASAAAEAAARLSLRGGKRMRAGLVAASYAACGGGDWTRASHAMLAVELLQTYLLIHDDWMDDDDVRRGGPSVHVHLRERLGSKSLGDAAAILAGDLACGWAQAALLESPLDPRCVLRAAQAFGRIQEEVVIGQLGEMRAIPGAAAPSVEQIHAMKTASYTVTGPLALGACLAGADDARTAELARYGRPLGIAFQLRDDLLGVFGDPSATGKPIWNDIRQGKRTALVAEMHDDALLGRVLGNAAASDADLRAVVLAMETSGARARVEARVTALCAEARAALEAMDLPGKDGKTWLDGAIAALGERSA
ncbi:MAG TPA: polyprenyl synthetase family protein [Labilithrix sp.]|jgi:geranylgeranyl diphosphate synthase type I